MQRILFITLLITLCLAHRREASAFWGSDTKETASGLNVAEGFDVNTITTVSGTVSTPPAQKGAEQHAVMTVATRQGSITVMLGPWWYWEKLGFAISQNQELSITGSQAQGKDGVRYLFAQKVENLSSGTSVTLRSETGKPLWSKGGGQGGERLQDGSGPRSGGGGRGYGMRGGRR